MRLANLVLLVIIPLISAPDGHAAIVLTSLAPSYSQDFNTLAFAGPSDVLPTGWYLNESSSAGNTFYNPDNGSSSNGDTYSYGEGTSTERALGMVLFGLSNPFRSTIGAQFSNGGDSEIIALSLSYRGEQWRLGAVLDPPREDRLDFEYSTTASGLTDAPSSWVAHNALDFTSPVITGTEGAKNGNAAGFNTLLSSTISGVSIPPSATFWIRWTDFNAAVSDDGLAVDDFTITATFAAVPEPGAVLFGGLVCGLIGLGLIGRRLVGRLKARLADG